MFDSNEPEGYDSYHAEQLKLLKSIARRIEFYKLTTVYIAVLATVALALYLADHF